jgi:hypothetical protein
MAAVKPPILNIISEPVRVVDAIGEVVAIVLSIQNAAGQAVEVRSTGHSEP